MSDEVSNLQTPSQTIGPFYAVGLTRASAHIEYSGAVGSEIQGEGDAIRITGRVFDGNGDFAQDAMIETFQANHEGEIAADNFLGLARSETGGSEDGRYNISTIKPGATSTEEAPYIAVIVHLRGLLIQAYTRIYFADEMDRNLSDPIFSQLPAARRDTLIAQRDDSSSQAIYTFDIHMQGDKETLFFQL